MQFGAGAVEHGFVPTYVPARMHVEIASERYRDHVSSDGSMRLYVDARSERGEAGGRAVAVMSESDDTHLPFDHRAAHPSTSVAGHPGWAGAHDGYRFVTWTTCPPEGCDHEWDVAVVAVGLTDDELLALAPHTTVTRDEVALHDLPEGMAAHAGGPLSLWGLGEGTGACACAAAVLRYEDGDRALQISMVDVRSPLGFLLRFTIAKPNGTRVRDQPAIRGRPITFDDTVAARTEAWTWKERGVRVVVLAANVARDEAERTIRSLRAASADDWSRLRREAARPAPTTTTVGSTHRP